LPAFSQYEGATLFLKGANSNYISLEDSFLMEAHFPNSNVTTIPNAGHWLHAENPSDFLKEVLEFLLG
jgi:esterase